MKSSRPTSYLKGCSKNEESQLTVDGRLAINVLFLDYCIIFIWRGVVIFTIATKWHIYFTTFREKRILMKIWRGRRFEMDFL